jgi:hypothetical protein
MWWKFVRKKKPLQASLLFFFPPNVFGILGEKFQICIQFFWIYIEFVFSPKFSKNICHHNVKIRQKKKKKKKTKF